MTTDITRADPISPAGAGPRWWRFGMVWFVLSGPALVVVAGFATMAIAFIHADVELHEPTPLSALSMRIGSQRSLPPGPTAQAGLDPARRQPAAPSR